MSDPRMHPLPLAPRTPITPEDVRPWRFVQWAGVVAVVGLVAVLFVGPPIALEFFWTAVVPLLPAVFLIHPGIWRNVCPLATVGMGAPDAPMGDRVTPGFRAATAVIGIVLLMVAVPARRLLLNDSSSALALFIVVVVVLAWGLARLFPRKAGFCNGICPVLPVERLYGQHPLIDVPNARCADCSACSAVGCLDLAPVKVVAQTLGPIRKTGLWTFTAFGAFAAAFPGFVLAYFLLDDLTLSAAPLVYGQAWGAALVSWALVTGTVILFRIPAHRMTPMLAGVAVGIYYWFAAPSAAVFAMGPPTAGPARATALLFIGVWTVRAMRRTTSTV